MVEKRTERSLGKKKDGGSLVTFLNKTTVTKLINIIREAFQSAGTREVKQAKMYSVQMDGTQDISSVNQCFIIVGYAYKGIIVDRLLFLINPRDLQSKTCLIC